MTAPAGRVVQADGHTWLAPHPRSLAWRRVVVGAVGISGTAIAIPVAEAQGLAGGLAVVVVTLTAAAGLLVAVWRGSHTRVGVGPAGVLVQRGARTRVLGWEAVDGIVSRVDKGAGRRARMVVDIAGDRRVEQVTLRVGEDEAARWRQAVAAHAPRSAKPERP